MRPRERVLAALAGEETFPIPADVFESCITPKLAARLLQHFGLDTADHEGLLDALGACVRWALPRYAGPPQEEDPTREAIYPLRKVTRGIWGTWEGLETYYDGLDRPLRFADSVAAIEAYAWPDPDWFDYETLGWYYDPPEAYRPMSAWVARHAEQARVIGGWSPVFCCLMDLFGMETGLRSLVERPDLVRAALAHMGEFYEEYYRRLARSAQGKFDFLAFGDDFAGQGAMLLSPKMWRAYFLPLWRRLFAIAHEHGMKSLIHSCGSVRPIIGDWVDAGLDVLAVVQTKAAGMDPSELKQEFGRHLAFYGGLDTQHLLPNGSPEQVREEVRRLCDILGKGGGYIIASSHVLMDDVPSENVLSLYDEARSYVRRNTNAGWATF